MSYDISESSGAVREVQRYLLEISHAYDWLPHLAVDGIYGERTRSCVRLVQLRYGLPPTGEADFETFTLIYDKYQEAEALNRHKPNQPFPAEGRAAPKAE